MSNGDAEISICKRQKVAPSEQIDRLSSLPDLLLAHILSCLPTKDAVKTVLIRRFGNLWTSIHNLDFDACLYHECDELNYDYRFEKRLINFIRHVLILHERSDIHRFRFKFAFSLWYASDSIDHLDSPETMRAVAEEFELANEIDTWIRFALRKRVKVLDLDFNACHYSAIDGLHKLTNFVLTSDSLAELKLVGCRVEPREHIHMQLLKSLSLDDVLISDQTMIEIISGCPVLESLFIYECSGLHKLNFTSLNLKNVGIKLNRRESSRLEVSCPYVTSLSISGIELTDLYNVSSIVDAALDFQNEFKCAGGEHHEVKMLFEQLYGAEVFTLFNRTILIFTMWELIRSSCPSMNWRRLVMKTMLTKWHLPGIASLLRSTPDLEMLDIHIQPGTKPLLPWDDQWLMQYEIDEENFWDFQRSSFHCLRSHLKTIRIHGFEIESCAVKLVQFLLRKACVLEKLVIETNRDSFTDKENLFTSETWKEFSKETQSSPRASPKAVILIL